jgi:serine/threonine protein kinase/Flp pilus assembly protein TadD
MTPKQWQKLQALFEEVTQKPPAERLAVMRSLETTVEDPVLREELRRLVEHAEPDASFLQPIPGILSSGVIQPGDLVAQRFEIIRLIGRGGMGEVFEALDQKLGERVAIKVIAREFTLDAGLLERFYREVQSARRISHPNVCRIHDLGEHNGMPYLSMELLEGETLAKRLERGPLALEEWEQQAKQLFDGLRAAHGVGIIHRDLKPSNLMIVGSRLVILDFGLARAVVTNDDSGLTHTGMLMGTLDWMAPEQLLGRFDERSDLYSAALILLQALRGKPSENESGGLAGALRRATGDTDFRKLLPASLPAAWRYVLLRCLERDPARRPERARDVQELLTRESGRVFGVLRSVFGRRSIRLSLVTALLLALAVLGFRYLGRPGLNPGSLIMVASTIDATGERRFDGITSVLRADLEQSSRFNVWDNQRLGEALRSMRRDTLSQPGTKDWREIASRENADLLVFSTVSPLGDGYTLAIRAEEMGQGPAAPLQSWERSWQTTGAEGLFVAEHEAAEWIRSKGGENDASVAANNRIPQSITSSSWDALELYQEAQKLSMAGRSPEAVPLFERAIQIDHQFAMALMRLGDILNSQYKSEEGFRYWNRAIELSRTQRLSDRESLSIESRYAMEIQDFKTALPVLRDWTRKYPNDLLAQQLLAACLSAMGQYEDAIRLARDTQKQFGPTVFGSSMLIRALAHKNRLSEIEPEIQALERLSNHALALQFRAMISALQGNYQSAARLFEELIAVGQGQDRSRAIDWLAILKADSGNLDDARTTLRRAIDSDREAGEDGFASQKMAVLAVVEDLAGNARQSRAWILQAADLRPSPQIIVEAVTLLARQGYVEDATRVMKMFPKGQGPRFDVATGRMRGEIQAALGNLRQAVEALELAARTEQGHGPKEYLARVLDMTGDRERAQLLYQEISSSPWMIWGSSEDDWPGVFMAKKHQEELKGK